MKINSSVKNTTIGPNCTIYENYIPPVLPDTTPPKAKHDDFHYEIPQSTLIISKLSIDLEKQRRMQVQRVVHLHANHVVESSKKLHADFNKKLEIGQQCLLNEKHQQELLILQASEQHDKEMSAQHQQLLKYYEELAECKKKIDRESKEYERRKQMLTAIIDKIKANQIEFRCTYQEIISCLESCKYPTDLKAVLEDLPRQLKVLPNDMEEIVNRCKCGKIGKDEASKSSQLVNNIKDVLNTLKQKITQVTEEQEAKKQQSISKPKVIIKYPEPTVLKMQTTNINKFISKRSLHSYSELQFFLEKYINSYNDLESDNSLKQFKFNCRKAINIPVNAISAVNSDHLLDKYNRLSSLLLGKTVEIGNVQVCAAQHPQGVAFCTNLLAKKFVLQGDLMISSKPEAAYCYAAIIIALWNDNADFGKLFLSHLYKECPYLVPFYPPQSIGQSDKEYYLSLGYQYHDNVIEKQDKFLKRMTGIMRLYSAIIIGKPKSGQNIHPYGITEGWRWLSSFLNLEPKSDITATMLHTFLEVAGSAMQMVYGKMFKKLMNFVCQVYLPMIQSTDTGGPVTRLEVLLQEYNKSQYFKTPSGVLPINFW
ncbi:hypothetical protein FQA39_LY03325 [Lamprigera yunnana]|nr:hypothetical protein FQA39_LY03325 [Lamprigera yunnana]